MISELKTFLAINLLYKTINHVKECAAIGADVATIPINVFDKLIKHPLTDAGLKQFTNDWNKTGQSIL